MKYFAIKSAEKGDDYEVVEFHGDPISFVDIMNLISEMNAGEVLSLMCLKEDKERRSM